jgi:transcriptional regulator with XRE-family HTH domain
MVRVQRQVNGRGTVQANVREASSQEAYQEASRPRSVSYSHSAFQQHPRADALTGLTFRTIREQEGLAISVLARRVGATPATIEVLESGQLSAFPGRAELTRLLAAYAVIAATDLTPIAQRLDKLLPHLTEIERQQAAAHQEYFGEHHATQTLTQRTRFKSMRVLLAGAPLLAILVLATTAHTSPQTLLAVTDTMPALMRGYAKSGLAMITPVKLTQSDGLVWIEVADPRSRKADRLMTSRIATR